MTKLTRRGLIGTTAGLAAPLFFVRNGWAEGKSINVGIYSGPQGDYIRKQVLPKFQAELGCRVFPTEGVTLTQISLLRAQKANPTFSVMFMDDVGVPIARDEDLITALPREKMPNMAHVIPRFLIGNGYGVAFAISSIAPFYNTKSGHPIASYAELWDPQYRGRYVMPTPKQTQSLDLLVATAALVTGKPFPEAQYLIDQAWDKLAALKPNVMTVYENNTTAILQVAQDQAAIGGPDFSKNVIPYTMKGAPVDLCYPKEGTFAGVNCITVVKGGPEPDLAAAFADRMLDKQVQTGLAEATYAAPSVAGLTIKPDVLSRIAYPEARMDELKLFIQDWSFFNPRRSAIVERLNQIFVA
jgi:putative spermidine/putrescine transport system substrate-binding protein